MWKTLLVPHDFSTCADAALRVAEGLAATHRASLLLLHVSDLPANVPPDARITPSAGDAPVRLDEWVARGASARLDDIAAPLRQRGLDVKTRARVGDICREITAAVDEEGVSAIVMGTHGREGLAHVLLGSIAEKVVRRSRVPVVTVREPEGNARATAEERAAEDELAG